MSRNLYIVAAAVIVAGCSSTPQMGNVIPGEGGVYQVIAKGESSDVALSSALHTAKTTCEQRSMRFVVLDQQAEYKGMVSEGANKALNQVSAIVAATTFQYVPTLSTEDDYRMAMRFKCEA